MGEVAMSSSCLLIRRNCMVPQHAAAESAPVSHCEPFKNMMPLVKDTVHLVPALQKR